MNARVAYVAVADPALRRLVKQVVAEEPRCEAPALLVVLCLTFLANPVSFGGGHERCAGESVGVRREDGFSDAVCEPHARRAEERGAPVVRAHASGDGGAA
jgi:hypothetical protein